MQADADRLQAAPVGSIFAVRHKNHMNGMDQKPQNGKPVCGGGLYIEDGIFKCTEKNLP